MILLPYRRIRIRTPLGPDEVYQKLLTVVEPERRRGLLDLLDPPKPYEGKLWKDAFAIRRVAFRNLTFMPVIRGDIADIGNYTEVAIAVYLPQSMAILPVALSIYTLILLFYSTNDPISLGPYNLSPTGTVGLLWLLSYVLLVADVQVEAARTGKFLRNLLQAE